MRQTQFAVIAILVIGLGVGACAKKNPPVARPLPPPPNVGNTGGNPPPPPPTPVPDTTPIPPEPTITEDPLAAGDLDIINKNSPFQPVFFGVDSFEVDSTAQQALTANAGILKKYPTWVITLEGHCDERGSAEYNLALGQRRAENVARALRAGGVKEDRLEAVSYGKEKPKAEGHDEKSWAENRRSDMVYR